MRFLIPSKCKSLPIILVFIFHNDWYDLFQQHNSNSSKIPLIQYIIYSSDLHDMHWYSTQLLRSSVSYNWLGKGWSRKWYYSPPEWLVLCISRTLSTKHEPFLQSWIPSHKWRKCNLKRNKVVLKRIQAPSSFFLQALSHDGRLLVQFTMSDRSMHFSSKHCN